MTSRPFTAASILAVLAIGLLLGTYVVGYFWLGERIDEPLIGFPPSYARERDELVAILRIYPQEWMETIFRPAAKVESWLRQIDVGVYPPVRDFDYRGSDSRMPVDLPSEEITDQELDRFVQQ